MTIETKFNVGDKVIFISNSVIRIGCVDAIKAMINKNKNDIYYSVYSVYMSEDKLFRNKEELFNTIEQQLKNANSQKTL